MNSAELFFCRANCSLDYWYTCSLCLLWDEAEMTLLLAWWLLMVLLLARLVLASMARPELVFKVVLLAMLGIWVWYTASLSPAEK